MMMILMNANNQCNTIQAQLYPHSIILARLSKQQNLLTSVMGCSIALKSDICATLNT